MGYWKIVSEGNIDVEIRSKVKIKHEGKVKSKVIKPNKNR